jgi:16S rRNA processing protein RimM
VIGGGTVFLTLSGITDRNVAETFRGKFLRVTRENALPLEEGRYFIVDIIDCVVKTDEGVTVGKVTDVFSARTDVFTLACEDGRVMRFPFLKDLVCSVDIENKLIIVKDKRLKEVSVYED